MWGSTYHCNFMGIIILQKKIIRIRFLLIVIRISVFFSKNRRFENSLTFIYTEQVNLCVFLNEVYFQIIFVTWLLLQAIYMQSQKYKKFWPFYIPHCVTNFPKFSIRFQGPEFFNSVSREKYQFVWRKT